MYLGLFCILQLPLANCQKTLNKLIVRWISYIHPIMYEIWFFKHSSHQFVWNKGKYIYYVYDKDFSSIWGNFKDANPKHLKQYNFSQLKEWSVVKILFQPYPINSYDVKSIKVNTWWRLTWSIWNFLRFLDARKQNKQKICWTIKSSSFIIFIQ